jgi:hypothetical protein
MSLLSIIDCLCYQVLTSLFTVPLFPGLPLFQVKADTKGMAASLTSKFEKVAIDAVATPELDGAVGGGGVVGNDVVEVRRATQFD